MMHHRVVGKVTQETSGKHVGTVAAKSNVGTVAAKHCFPYSEDDDNKVKIFFMSIEQDKQSVT